MKMTVPDVAKALEQRGLLRRRRRDQSPRVIPYITEIVGRQISKDLEDFYRENIDQIASYSAFAPIWSDWVGWRSEVEPDTLLNAEAVPIFGDGCGSYFAVDISKPDSSSVYFFDHEDGYAFPAYAVGSSLPAFLLLLAEYDRAHEEKWPDKWELTIDPDLEKCSRAPAIWAAS